MTMQEKKADNKQLFELVLASSVHDMKNSVGMLIGKLDAINSMHSSEHCESSVTLSDLQYESQRIHHHLMQLLTIYRMQNQQYSLTIDEHCVNEMLAEVTVPLSQQLEQKDISLEVKCNPELYAFFDLELTSGIISNVINNAWRYAKSRLEINAGINADKHLVITISDDGEGYPESILKQDSFDQNKIDFQSGGTGLGLYFSSLVAQMHCNKDCCGSVKIDNGGIDGGARFVLVLP